MRPTAFICGPYYNTEPSILTKNIERAREAAVWLWDNGYYAFCPHLNTANFHILTNQSEEVYRAFALNVIRSGLIQLLVMLQGWKNSDGSNNEFHLARVLEIPIFEYSHNSLLRLF